MNRRPLGVGTANPCRRRQASAGAPPSESCPACRKPVHYIPATDRYSHDDGSENARCWTAVFRSSLAVVAQIEPLPAPEGYEWLNVRRGVTTC